MKFDFGDNAKVIDNADEIFRPGEIVAICFISKIESNESSEAFDRDINSYIYTIEFTDGSSITIPEDLLEETDET